MAIDCNTLTICKMKTEILTKRTYEAPDMSVQKIQMEQCILSTVTPGSLQDMDPNDLYNEDF